MICVPSDFSIIQMHSSSLQQKLVSLLNQNLFIREQVLVSKNESLLELPGLIKSDTDWDEFLSNYDECNHHVLNQLRRENPKLTDADLIYIMLCRMGKTPHEISLLPDTSDRTVWNRRQLLKDHLENGETAALLNC